ncbi:RING/FYVE/PHD zinc finger superfamily protein [Hibiscus syriacus]|uniref:RING/FYVE/PHD zinc finger superfamily protein n=1 Tax=Hibiscus syriacus TaxID=106335 RepID=A0A6A2Y1X4_HIBSY|nr:RING/FYVE/PHD zinc finger superfamily protein [Hibiscus syriacus]
MADIAMLVAEEYERRLKLSRNRAGSDQNRMEIHLLSWVPNMAQKLKTTNLGTQTIELFNSALQPKTQIGAQAFNGAFSA